MPELRAKKLTRAQESARHAYRRALAKAVRVAAKGSGWRSNGGRLFQEKSGWFFSLWPSVYINQERTKALVSVKPMSIDPIFWEIVGLPENNKLPLSFRCRGAWVCHPPHFAEVDVAEGTDTGAVAARMRAIADEQLQGVIETWTPTAFLAFCQTAPAIPGSYLPCIVTALITLGREEAALAVCDEAILKRQAGGFSFRRMTFPEMAVEWLRSRASAWTIH